MAPSTIVVQSIIFEDDRIQFSYFDPEGQGPYGMEIRTPVILNINGAFDPELAELTDACEQLLMAWEGRRREGHRPKGLPGR